MVDMYRPLPEHDNYSSNGVATTMMFATKIYANCGILWVSTQVTAALLVREFPQQWPW